jgi:hypothetical protein
MRSENQDRARNPFRELMVTELIDNPKLYRKMFSEQILIGETLTVFRPINTVLVGPQGSGKSMILNLLRYRVLAEYVSGGEIHEHLSFLNPFLGISINLQRAYFQAFGRRSAAVPRGSDLDVDASCAADYLNHFLFSEFLRALIFLISEPGAAIRHWMKLSRSRSREVELATAMSEWRCWYGYYRGARTLNDLLLRAETRIDLWRSFLNTAIDAVPSEVWSTKTMIGDPLHYMGNLLQDTTQKGERLPLYVVIDQYEVLPELNPTHGTTLQRVVNTLVKARDPVVFYRIGARTYDWGKELRVWGAESRIELQRDYVVVDLTDALMRNENTARSTFSDLATDVAVKRLREAGYAVGPKAVATLFGPDSPEEEARSYIRRKPAGQSVVLGTLPIEYVADIERTCGANASPLDLRLAAAWVFQRLGHGDSNSRIRAEMRTRPWERAWWRKERILAALCQIASLTHEKKHYWGWQTVIDLSGANIAAFLLLASEVWDVATKFGHEPIDSEGRPNTIPKDVQSDGIRVASTKWVQRDRLETTGGSRRYAILSRLGPAIHDAVIGDRGLSNPGHTGFSLREIDIQRDCSVQEFLRNGVSWAILEERAHTSKNQQDTARRKYYLHPLLSPTFEIPHKRVKEPLYIAYEQAVEWFTTNNPIRFTGIKRHRSRIAGETQSYLPFGR